MAELLVVEDEDELRELLRLNLEHDGHVVRDAGSAEEALELLEGVEVILLDLVLPGMSGIELLRTLQNEAPQVPVIVLTARNQLNDKVEALDSGAFDFVAKPYEPKELLARVRGAARVQEALEVTRRLEARLREETAVDPLTGLLNRRALEFRLDEECARLARGLGPSSVLMVDVDAFGELNRLLGADRADGVLVEVARRISSACRRSDVVFRFGGEEFFILLAGSLLDGAIAVGERIAEGVRRSPILPDRAVTVSVGATEIRPHDSPSVLIARAQRAVAKVKASGQDGVSSATGDSIEAESIN